MIILLFTLVIAALVLWFINDIYIKGKDRPPGPLRLPLLGNLLQMVAWKQTFPEPHIMLHNFSKMYGSVATLQQGFLEQVIVDDHELVKKILQGDNFAQRPVHDFVLERSFGKQLGILWSRGDVNKEIRRFSIRTLRDFGFGKQRSQEAVMEEELQELMSRLNSRLDSEGPVVFIQQFFNISILNIIWSMVAGLRFSHDDPELNKLVSMLNKTMRLLSVTGNILFAYPFLRHIMPIFTNSGTVRKECLGQLQNTFRTILTDRRKLGHYKDEQNDFIDVFLVELDKHKNDSLGKIYTEEQFVITVQDLFAAGSETTSNSLEFAILYMIHNPSVQTKVQEEIDRVIGRTKFPNFTDKQEMPYTDATILEILRLSSVVPVTTRCPLVDTTIGTYSVKKETFVVLSAYSVHMNPKLWENPTSFDPERFLDANKNVINADKIVPFGLGKRNCLGEVLARASLFTFFVVCLQNYTFTKSPDHPDPPLDGVSGLTLSPQPYYAVITRRPF